MDSSTGCCGSPAPFLLKTYEMVDDPLTSCIVSWSDTGCSFVVWNSPEFCRDLLPKYFKHNNFSSFVRQLNTYGFRKVDPERWEFANRYFIKGKTDLLTNICRRKPVHDHSGSRGNSVVVTVSEREELEEEIGRLKQEKRSLESAVEKYKYENERYRNQIRLLGQMLINVGGEQPLMMASLTKFLEKPWYVEQPQGLKGKRRMLAYNEVNPGLSPSLMLQDNTSFSSGPSCIIQAVEKLDSSLTPWESFGHGINHTPSQIVKDLTSASAASYEELATEMAALSADSNSNVSQGTFLNIAASSRHADSPRISSKFGDPGHKLCEVSVKEIKDGEDGRSIPPLPAGTNDVFWEQFLIEAPVSSITQEV